MVARNVDRTLLVGLIEQIDAEIERDLCEHYQDANKLLFDELVGAREPGATEALPTVPAALAPGANAAVRLAGIGDLITVEERLKAYIAGEIAHVENLVKGAKRSREHILTITDEETVETFRLSEKEARKSLETNTRTELSTTASQAAQESFAIDAGLNVSGQYGMTSVTATLDAQYQREQTEAESVATANVQEVIAKTEERFKTTESTLRRTLSHRQSKETNNETFQTDLTRSEIYLWVEQQREVRLLHKGSRMFVEYFVPEPAADLRQPTTAGGLLPPPALSISASELSEMNFAAYAAFYRAPGVDPPPAERVQVPFSYTSAVDKEAGHDQSDTSLVAITIPDGYVPSAVKFSAHGFEPQDEVHWFLSVGGQTMARETTWLEAATGLAPVLTRRKTLQLSVGAPQGMNAVLVVSGHFQKTAGLDGVLECRRSCELLAAWQLKTFTKLVQAHTALTEEYERAQRTRGVRPDLAGGPSTENRVTEKRELKKWCKTLLGALPPGNDPFVRGAPWSELDAAKASEQAFISEFFEKAFEWQEMTYFLFGYDVAPKARWSSLLASKSADPSHTAFLQAGAARVLVPVSPRFEPIIARYLQSTTVPTAQEIEEWQRQRLASEESQIDAITSQPSTLETVNLYLELLVARKPNVVVGSGALQMVQGSKVATLTDSLWKIGQIDVGRKVYIGTFESTVAKTDAGRNELELADAWRDVNDTVAFAVDAVQVGDSWSIVLPTPLIVHADALPTVDAINRQIAQRPWH